MALEFGPPEYFAIGVFGLSVVVGLSGKSVAKGLLSAAFGVLLSTSGLDPVNGTLRFTFGIPQMMGGVELLAALIGLFAISEVLERVTQRSTTQVKAGIQRGRGVPLKELWKHRALMLRSAAIGTIIGIIPGTGGGTASWLSYNEAKRTSKEPEKFGDGALEGLIAPETANNAVTGGALVPLLTLGVPGDSVTAVLLGALMIQGITPGPTLFVEQPEVATGIYALKILSNLLLLILGLAFIHLFVQVIRIPESVLVPSTLVLCCVGAFAMRNQIFDVIVAMVLGFIGYFMKRADYPVPPVLLGLVLGGMVESNFRRSLLISKGSLAIFVQDPICLLFLCLAVLGLAWGMRRKKQK